MKKGIHPKYVEATITCACGNVVPTTSIKPAIKTEICSKCHPFFTGQQRIIDTGGKVERFMRRLKAAEEAEKALVAKREAKAARRPREEREEEPAYKGSPEESPVEGASEEASK